MKINNGFITLHRKIINHPVFQNSKLFKLFITLLFEANYEDTRFLSQKHGEILIKRGQLVTGRNKLSKLSHLNPNTIKCLLVTLVKLQIITTKTTNKYSVITIVKYDDYQKVQKTSPANSPTKHQQNTNKTPQSNKENKDNNINKDATTLFDKFKNNPLWEVIIKKYPDRDYQYQFNLMLDWWRSKNKKDPQAISALKTG